MFKHMASDFGGLVFDFCTRDYVRRHCQKFKVILIPRMPEYVHMYVSVIVKSRVPTINIVPYPECVCVWICHLLHACCVTHLFFLIQLP